MNELRKRELVDEYLQKSVEVVAIKSQTTQMLQHIKNVEDLIDTVDKESHDEGYDKGYAEGKKAWIDTKRN